MMKKQDNHEINNPQSVIEELTVNEHKAAEVKGGALLDGSVRAVRDSIALNHW